MDMGMKLELLSPGVKHAEESDFGTETEGIGGYGLQCLCAGVKQQIVEEFLVLQCQGGKFSGHGEDHMNIGRGQKLVTACFQPSLSGIALAFWAMSIATRVERACAIAAVGTLIQMPTESDGATTFDGAQHLQMLCCKPVAVLLDEIMSGHTDQIGHLPLLPLHLLLLFFSKRERVQRAGGSADMTLREVQVDGGFFQIAMSEKELNRAQVGPSLE